MSHRGSDAFRVEFAAMVDQQVNRNCRVPLGVDALHDVLTKQVFPHPVGPLSVIGGSSVTLWPHPLAKSGLKSAALRRLTSQTCRMKIVCAY